MVRPQRTVRFPQRYLLRRADDPGADSALIRREAAAAGVEPLGSSITPTRMTLLETLRDGASGFSGVMGNLHPELYVWLDQNWHDAAGKARRSLQALLTLLS